MAKYTILEIRGLSGGKGLNPNQKAIKDINETLDRAPIGDVSIDNKKKEISAVKGVSSVLKGLSKDSNAKAYSASKLYYDTFLDMTAPMKEDALNKGQEEVYKNLIKQEDELEELKNEYYKASKKDRQKAIRNTIGKVTASLHYANQIYNMYNQHQMNTYTMAGMTTAAIKQQKQKQTIGLVNKGVGIGIAFAVNPILGAIQTVLTLGQQIFELYENQRKHVYEQAREQYSSNYYRNRLVKNMEVLI